MGLGLSVSSLGLKSPQCLLAGAAADLRLPASVARAHRAHSVLTAPAFPAVPARPYIRGYVHSLGASRLEKEDDPRAGCELLQGHMKQG